MKYVTHHSWPADCFWQGGFGIVIKPSGPTMEQALTDPDKAFEILAGRAPHYVTAFFEAFPRNPDTFLRGEGETVETAEDDCWTQWQKILACPAHEFDRRGRTDGYCYCKHCELSGMFMRPLDCERGEVKQ